MSLPPLGPEIPAYECQKATGEWDELCGKPARWHVIWDDTTENSLACGLHVREIRQHPDWKPRQIHHRAPDCAMPGSHWFEDERTCRVPPSDDAPDVLMEERELVFARKGGLANDTQKSDSP